MVALPRTALTPFRYIARLPRGSDRAVGGGYAMAMAAAGATACYYLVVGVAIAVIGVRLAAAGDTVPVAFLVMAPVGLAMGTLQTAVFVAIPAFVCGVVAFRVVSADRRYAGPLAGLLATLLTYLVGGVLLAAIVLPLALLRGPTPSSAINAAGSALGILTVAFLATSWAALPLGAGAGALYDRTRAQLGMV